MTTYLIVILFFIAVLLALVTVFMAYEVIRTSPSVELRKRLKELAVNADERLPADLRVDIMLGVSPVDRFLYKFGLIKRLNKLISNAGLKIDMKIFILLTIAAALAGLCAGIALGEQVILFVLLATLGFIAPFIYLKTMTNRRISRFTEQFPNGLDMIARSLRAGHSLSSAILMVGKEMGDPIAGLFKIVYDEQSLGLTMKDALEQMQQRIKSPDLQLFVAAVNIHRDIGGNLAETLEKLGDTIRDRLKIRRQVKVFSAQARLSAVVLVLLPIVMAFFFYFRVPGYLQELLTTDMGRYGIAFAVISQLLGIIVIKKIIDIRI